MSLRCDEPGRPQGSPLPYFNETCSGWLVYGRGDPCGRPGIFNVEEKD